MERLTEKRDGQNVIPLRQDGKTKWSLCSAGMGNAPTQFLYGVYADKLAEYEDFEEIFRSKMTDAACEFLKDKEEFARWLDRNKWIAKKCDEYARAEEQKKLIKLPCAVGDTMYTNTSMQGWHFKKKDRPYKVKVVFIGINGVDNCMHVSILVFGYWQNYFPHQRISRSRIERNGLMTGKR